MSLKAGWIITSHREFPSEVLKNYIVKGEIIIYGTYRKTKTVN